MIQIWGRLVRKLRGEPSQQTVEARQRLEAVRRDDARVDRTINRSKEIVRENHFAPMIAKLFEPRSPGQ